MKKSRIDSDRPIGRMTRIEDFLPPPEKLVIPEDTIKVTLILKKSSIAFFKQKASQYHTKYQKMIRELVNNYAMTYYS